MLRPQHRVLLLLVTRVMRPSASCQTVIVQARAHLEGYSLWVFVFSGRKLSRADRVYIQSDVPQFVLFTADDAVQSYTLDAVNQFLAQRKNPNGCPLKMTYFTSLNYTNYTLVTGTKFFVMRCDPRDP